jgi:hypothetical protein
MKRRFSAAFLLCSTFLLLQHQEAYAQAALWRAVAAAIAAGWSTEAIAKQFGFGSNDEESVQKAKRSQIDACVKAFRKATDGRGDLDYIEFICNKPEILADFKKK